MRAEGQSISDAKELMSKFINEKANLYIKDGNLFALGEALHPIMDSTSPTHEGFQEWKGIKDLQTLIEAIKHVKGERKVTYKKLLETIEKVQEFFNNVQEQRDNYLNDPKNQNIIDNFSDLINTNKGIYIDGMKINDPY